MPSPLQAAEAYARRSADAQRAETRVLIAEAADMQARTKTIRDEWSPPARSADVTAARKYTAPHRSPPTSHGQLAATPSHRSAEVSPATVAYPSSRAREHAHREPLPQRTGQTRAARDAGDGGTISGTTAKSRLDALDAYMAGRTAGEVVLDLLVAARHGGTHARPDDPEHIDAASRDIIESCFLAAFSDTIAAAGAPYFNSSPRSPSTSAAALTRPPTSPCGGDDDFNLGAFLASRAFAATFRPALVNRVVAGLGLDGGDDRRGSGAYGDGDGGDGAIDAEGLDDHRRDDEEDEDEVVEDKEVESPVAEARRMRLSSAAAARVGAKVVHRVEAPPPPPPPPPLQQAAIRRERHINATATPVQLLTPPMLNSSQLQGDSGDGGGAGGVGLQGDDHSSAARDARGDTVAPPRSSSGEGRPRSATANRHRRGVAQVDAAARRREQQHATLQHDSVSFSTHPSDGVGASTAPPALSQQQQQQRRVDIVLGRDSGRRAALQSAGFVDADNAAPFVVTPSAVSASNFNFAAAGRSDGADAHVAEQTPSNVSPMHNRARDWTTPAASAAGADAGAHGAAVAAEAAALRRQGVAVNVAGAMVGGLAAGRGASPAASPQPPPPPNSAVSGDAAGEAFDSRPSVQVILQPAPPFDEDGRWRAVEVAVSVARATIEAAAARAAVAAPQHSPPAASPETTGGVGAISNAAAAPQPIVATASPQASVPQLAQTLGASPDAAGPSPPATAASSTAPPARPLPLRLSARRLASGGGRLHHTFPEEMILPPGATPTAPPATPPLPQQEAQAAGGGAAFNSLSAAPRLRFNFNDGAQLRYGVSPAPRQRLAAPVPTPSAPPLSRERPSDSPSALGEHPAVDTAVAAVRSLLWPPHKGGWGGAAYAPLLTSLAVAAAAAPPSVLRAAAGPAPVAAALSDALRALLAGLGAALDAGAIVADATAATAAVAAVGAPGGACAAVAHAAATDAATSVSAAAAAPLSGSAHRVENSRANSLMWPDVAHESTDGGVHIDMSASPAHMRYSGTSHSSDSSSGYIAARSTLNDVTPPLNRSPKNDTANGRAAQPVPLPSAPPAVDGQPAYQQRAASTTAVSAVQPNLTGNPQQVGGVSAAANVDTAPIDAAPQRLGDLESQHQWRRWPLPQPPYQPPMGATSLAVPNRPSLTRPLALHSAQSLPQMPYLLNLLARGPHAPGPAGATAAEWAGAQHAVRSPGATEDGSGAGYAYFSAPSNASGVSP